MHCWHGLNKDAASGVDGLTAETYATNLEGNIADLAERVKAGRYRAKLVRRVYIPKENGKERPLGIPALEDKLVQLACAKLLGAIYEEDFLDCSHGYRPGRSAKDTVCDLTFELMYGKFGFLVEADVRGFFSPGMSTSSMTMSEGCAPNCRRASSPSAARHRSKPAVSSADCMSSRAVGSSSAYRTRNRALRPYIFNRRIWQSRATGWISFAPRRMGRSRVHCGTPRAASLGWADSKTAHPGTTCPALGGVQAGRAHRMPAVAPSRALSSPCGKGMTTAPIASRRSRSASSTPWRPPSGAPRCASPLRADPGSMDSEVTDSACVGKSHEP